MVTRVQKAVVFLVPTLALACANGVGTSDGSTGAAGLALQLKALQPGQHYRTLDGAILEFSTFEFSFAELSLGDGLSSEAGFTAEFATEEAEDVAEIEALEAGEYDEITLTFGPSDEESETAELEDFEGDETIHIAATAALDGESCRLDIALHTTESLSVVVAEEGVEIVPGEEVEIPVEVDPDLIFGTVSLPSTCTGGATVAINADENPETAAEILENILAHGALRLAASEGHAHE